MTTIYHIETQITFREKSKQEISYLNSVEYSNMTSVSWNVLFHLVAMYVMTVTHVKVGDAYLPHIYDILYECLSVVVFRYLLSAFVFVLLKREYY